MFQSDQGPYDALFYIMDVQFSDYRTVSRSTKPVAELSALERWRRDAAVKSSRTSKNKWSFHEYLSFLKETPYVNTLVLGRSAEETRLAHIRKTQRTQARSGGRSKEISSRIARAVETHGAGNVLDVGCWVGAEEQFEFKSRAQSDPALSQHGR